MISRRRFLQTVVQASVAVAGGQWAAAPQAAQGLTVTDLPLLSTADWGALPPLSPPQFLERQPKGIVLHHSARTNSVETTRGRAIAIAQAIQHGHFDNGWLDTGQHFTVSRGGWVLEGRHGTLDALRAGAGMVVGTHTPAANHTHLGIECEGTYSTETPPPALRASLVQLCAVICRQYDLQPASIRPHRDWTSTECPGEAFTATLDALRAEVGAVLAANRPAAWPELTPGMWRRQVRAVQELLRAQGLATPRNGRLDSATSAAIRELQQQRGLQLSGAIGAPEWQALVVDVAASSRGPAVAALQALLRVPLTEHLDAPTSAALAAILGQPVCRAADWQQLVRATY